MSDGETERNWARNVTFAPSTLHRPTDVEEVRRLVVAAVGAGRRVHALGTRHSFSTVAASEGELIDLTGLSRLVGIDAERRTVTVQAGIRYGELSRALNGAGFGLANLPSLPHVSVAGAIATGTHGSGARNGSLSTSVVALTLLTAGGDLLTLERDGADAERFRGAVVALGALGVVVELTLEVEPTYEIAQTVTLELPAAEALARIDELMGSAYSVSLFTDYQGRGFRQLWSKRRLDGPASADRFGGVAAAHAIHPIGALDAAACTEQLGVPGPWHERLPHFRLEFTPSNGDELQTEYFVDATDGPAALEVLFGLAEQLRPLLQISEVRAVRADDLWLSGAYVRDTIALHFTWVPDQPAVEAFLPKLEAALEPFAPRPHWGKLTAMAPSTIRSRFERFDDFASVAAELDPQGTFRNAYLDRLLDG